MFKVGDRIRINQMKGESTYDGRVGIIQHIDDQNQLHGTWGGLAVIPEVDQVEVIQNEVQHL
jgi:hypothetical protein